MRIKSTVLFVQPISEFRRKNNEKRNALKVLVDMLSHQTFTHSKSTIKTLEHVFALFFKRL